ncbi:slit homolog 2 protein-like [Ostrea edulis]|uniref:slit homolog 2 protein-like n=1 Tax=Ostrea edulis TaxID=37623 RepID=UPI0024AF3870|nr:slit homolog 2 protein-like [Ostrea edulis]
MFIYTLYNISVIRPTNCVLFKTERQRDPFPSSAMTRLICTCLYVLWAVTVNAQPCPSLCYCRPPGQVFCNGTGISKIPDDVPKDTRILYIGDNPITEIKRSSMSKLINLTALDASRASLKEGSIEAGALDLPNLTDVDMSGTDYTTIPKELPKKLVTYRMMMGKLETLQSDSFIRYPNIVYLDLSNNNIYKIQQGTFDPLVNMTTLYIGFNKLTDASFPSNVFSKCRSIQSIDLRFNQMQNVLQNIPGCIQHLCYVGNKIKTLHAYSFKDLVNLQTLAFWEGDVETIEDNAFYGLDKLTLLDFMQDHIISALTNLTFVGLSSVDTLYLDLNNISKMEVGALYPLRSVGSLWLQSNMLTTLKEGVLDTNYLTKLNTLFIDSNPWYCDCNLRWLREKMDHAPYVIQDPHLIVCKGPPKVAGKAWDVLKPSDFVCNNNS